MDPTWPWNSLEIAKLLVSVLTPLSIGLLGFWFNRRLHKLESEREDSRRTEEARKRKARDELERRFVPHIEFDIDCHFYGPHQGKYAAEFTLSASNKGITRHEFTSVLLRVRGVTQEASLRFWAKHYPHRLEFPEAILKDEVKPRNWNYIFVEPGVTQRLTYSTIIDEEIRLITARAEFHYARYTPHSTERMFEVRAPKV
ncbi:hypothetical protein [Thiocapsa bogorovii]|uniref:hypothetical protein n=1 Tax=Thiocapsa bogorovii TaxID=521689 RepID=UPI001E453133|nr:hypothetical protein [Thiocapsa bogorovii]UHD15036.1 hypothetical protein LT988_17350 [Thiocapsa bogorovii]